MRQIEAGGIAVSLRIVPEVFETGIALPGAAYRFRIDLRQVTQNGLNRSEQAIEIETVKACFVLSGWKLIIVLPQPSHEIEHVGIAPHPCRKALEIVERIDRLGIARITADKSVDAIRIRPVRFNGDSRKLPFLDQTLCDFGPLPIELMGTVRSFANKGNP